ncbi:2OG-Fe(II) oxygenase [Gammaproteobacteria bacterium]|jgi:prolyl 4-hydroxylase|nr:2OG-Fe(II) oxygenase [Gammaproteobacteria bacterium]MDC1361146.1 2OG-Fe(II) oxygenase [Gammaproteobacteria bacterium]
MNTEFPKKIADNVTLFSSDPIIYVVDDFISEDECQEFINCSKDKLQPATVVGLDNEQKLKDRTNEFAWLEHHANESIHEVSKRLSILVQMPIRNAEMFQVVHYERGTEYKPHFDSFDQSTELGKKYWEPGGQRMITALIYLNDVEDGGATYFPELNISINPKKGNVLVFHNTISETTNINPRSLHAGMPVSSGEKWAANLWFRENLRY